MPSPASCTTAALKDAQAFVLAAVVACATPAETPRDVVERTNGLGKNLTPDEAKRPAVAAKEASSLRRLVATLTWRESRRTGKLARAQRLWHARPRPTVLDEFPSSRRI
jgi:hypothetical protein